MFTSEELITHLRQYPGLLTLERVVKHCWATGAGWTVTGKVCSYYGYSPIQSWQKMVDIKNAADENYSDISGAILLKPYARTHMPWGLTHVCLKGGVCDVY